MKKLLIILLLIVGCGILKEDDDKTYKCEVDCEILEVEYENDVSVNLISCYKPLLQVDAVDIDEAEEYCYDWYELDSLNNVYFTYSCTCEVFP